MSSSDVLFQNLTCRHMSKLAIGLDLSFKSGNDWAYKFMDVSVSFSVHRAMDWPDVATVPGVDDPGSQALSHSR